MQRVEQGAGEAALAAGPDPPGLGVDQRVQPLAGGAGDPGVGIFVETSLAGDDPAVLDLCR